MPSRTSSKSSLSPSSGRGSSAIDLGKDSGVDLGKKSQVSTSSGGIGVTQEITNIGGLSVTGGVSVDISPIGLDISADPTKGEVSVAASAEIPGGLLGVGGGVTVDTSTGEIKGGSISGEVAGIGVEVSKDEDGNIGLGVSVQVPFTPISFGLGIKPAPKKENKTPSPSPSPSLPPGTLSPEQIDAVMPFNTCSSFCITGHYNDLGDGSEGRTHGFCYKYRPFVDFRGRPKGGGIVGWNDEFINDLPDAEENYSSLAQMTEVINNYSDITILYYTVPNTIRNNCFPSPSPSPSPSPLLLISPPNPPPRKEMDVCCRESIKLMRAIYLGLGIQKFPGQLPSTVIQEVSAEGEVAPEPPQEPIADFADLLMWMFRRDDERWGQWKIQIKVKDSDLTKEGNQEKQVKLPNLAESIAEIEGQMLSLQANVEALVAMQTRNLCESGMARQEAIKAYLASMAIAKYMNFPYKETDIEIPSTFTPQAESIDELIKESTIHAKGIEYEDKETQRDILLDLLQAAAITRAVHWRQVNPKQDIKSQILELVKGSANLSDKLANPIGDTDKPKSGKDWEDFLDQVEDGFGYEAGIENAQTPYGRSRDRRPRIRQIGDNIDQAGKTDG